MQINYNSIGVIHTPYKERNGTPIQPVGAKGIEGTIELDEQYIEALTDLGGFSHIILIYHLHRSDGWKSLVTPFMDNVEHGVFATRAPARPNAIGLSVVQLHEISGNKLLVSGVDIIDGTPLLDIKPYVPAFDQIEKSRTGWLEKNAVKATSQKADERFK